MPGYKLSVQFCEDVTKIYDVKLLFEQLPVFAALQNEEEFFGVVVDAGGYGIIWNADLDLSCDELWENGVDVCKFGKQWVVLSEAMKREYGTADSRNIFGTKSDVKII